MPVFLLLAAIAVVTGVAIRRARTGRARRRVAVIAVASAVVVAAAAAAVVAARPRPHWEVTDNACFDRELSYGRAPYYPGSHDVIRPGSSVAVESVVTGENGVHEVLLEHPEGYQPIRLSEPSLYEYAHRC